MPTKNPRLTLTLSPSLAAQLRRMSELTGNSQAALISELLEGNEKVFARLIQVLEAAKSAKGDMVAKFSEDMGAAQQKIEAQLGLALEAIDEPTHSLLKEAERIKRRGARTTGEGTRLRGGSTAPGATRSASSPPLLTGGSGTPSKPSRKARNAPI
jgi:DNA-binding ferritin-like protein